MKQLFSLLFPIDIENVFKGTMYTMILSATAHLLTCLYNAIHFGNPDIINMFNVIGLSLIFPSLGHGALNCLLGILFVIAIGVLFYAIQQKHDQHPESRRQKNTHS
jgi:hypothetical protein